MIEWSGVTVARGGRRLVDGVSLRVAPGEIVALTGPNGAGKSTLVRAMTGEWPVARGAVRLFDRDLRDWSRPALARRFGALPQRPALAFDFLVEEVVALGRLPHTAAAGRAPVAGREVVGAALAEVGLAGFERRSYLALSTGEQHRVQFARLLAQLWEAGTDGGSGAAALLLDEPTAALDLGQQQRLLELVWRWSRGGAAVAIVLHDLNLAARYADRLAVVAGGSLVALGPPAQVLDAALLGRVYGCEVRVDRAPDDDRPVVLLPGPRRSAPADGTRSGGTAT